VLASSSEPAIVAAHSMGGVIATHGSARCPERVAALVYVSAFMPRDGQSLLDLTKLPEGADDQVQANLTIAGDSPVAVLSNAASRAALYGCCAEDVAAWAIARQTPQPLAPFGTPASIPPGALAGTKRYFVLCTQDRAIPPALQRRMIAETGCDEVIELNTDHTPHLSMPKELASALHHFATQSMPSKLVAAVPPSDRQNEGELRKRILLLGVDPETGLF